MGETVGRGELLFQIDERDTRAAVNRAKAEAARWASTLERIQKQSSFDAERLKTLERNRELTEKKYKRLLELFDQHTIGTRTGVEQAEQAYNKAADQADQMAQTVALYPLRIKESRSSLDAARADLAHAEANLSRCRITAPFKGRLKNVVAEQGQYVAPGQALVTLADDTIMEIHVPLDSLDVRRWLRFSDSGVEKTGSWFDRPEPVECFIRWTEDQEGYNWTGRLHRVVGFDSKTRTVTVAVRTTAAETRGRQPDSFPLVEGMFCQVHIPGRTVPNAFRLPRQAVSFNNTVYAAVDNRLKTLPVQIAHFTQDEAFIIGGLNPGDLVITTRLVDPMENALLEINE
jgi:RND family efflux transporter MFP subunit